MLVVFDCASAPKVLDKRTKSKIVGADPLPWRQQSIHHNANVTEVEEDCESIHFIVFSLYLHTINELWCAKISSAMLCKSNKQIYNAELY